MVETQTFASVWDAIADSPEEAADLKLRAKLMNAIEAYIRCRRITEHVAAKRLGIPLSRLKHLTDGRIDQFSHDELVVMASKVGIS